MTTCWIARTASIALSALLTLGVLGAIDQMAQPDAAGSAQWAQAAAPQA